MDMPVFEVAGEGWYFFAEWLRNVNGFVGKLYGPYLTKTVADERREAVEAFTEYAPACHHVSHC